jgi:hypothetical protein
LPSEEPLRCSEALIYNKRVGYKRVRSGRLLNQQRRETMIRIIICLTFGSFCAYMLWILVNQWVQIFREM